MPNLTPEQRARETIDAILAASGWAVQSKDAVNLAASRGVAICELSFATGAPNYTLFVDGRAIGTVEAGFYVDKRDRQTRNVRWEQLDEVLAYDASDLDRDVVAPDQIRKVAEAFRLCSSEQEQRRDAAATIPEVEVCTWQRTSSLTPEQILSAFRNSYNPRIAVTVDMIATGMDIKPLEIVFFMRSVASKNFFEQMKGRGVRVVSDTEMEQVNPGVKRKTRYLIVDAVGVCERVLTESRPLEKKPTVTFEKLLDAAALGTTEVVVVESLAGRLIRLERRFDGELEAEVVKTAKGQTLSGISKAMLAALDPDHIETEARRLMVAAQSGSGVSPLDGHSGSGVSPLDGHSGSGVSPLDGQGSSGVWPLFAAEDQSRDGSATLLNYFDPEATVAFLSGDLPHWRQPGTTYFVTFRLADSLPQELLKRWRNERDAWMASHPEPHDEPTRREYYELFPQRLQKWLDADSGSCVLALPEIKPLVEGALRHFDGQRYTLDEFVVAANHVHAILSPRDGHDLSEILHSWKSFTAHEILKVEAASRRLTDAQQSRDGSATIKVWQKESFDHIVRNPASMDHFRAYIRAHGSKSGSGVPPLFYCHETADFLYLTPTDKQRRDAAATLIRHALAPLATNPDLRNLLKRIAKASEQTRIVAEVERRLSVVEELESVVSANLQRAARLRQAVLQKAFTGEL